MPPEHGATAFKLTDKQTEANKLLASSATHILLRGGSRSGKTFVLVRAIVIRALKAPNSRHGIFRHAFNHVKQSVVLDTFPKVMKLCFPGVQVKINQTDWFAKLPNGSEIWFGGLDEAERVEKVLGKEFSTIFLNEASQISYKARNMLLTRLAQDSGLALKEYIDANPPSVGHFLYRMFEQKLEPISGKSLADPADYATMQLNPGANRANLAPAYIAQLESLPEKDRRRFLLGEYLAQVDGALWTLDTLDRARVSEDQVPPLRRIVVAIDPSGCRGPEDFRSDEIGIVAAGIDAQGVAYVLEDATGRYSPEGWGRAALRLYDRHQADLIVAESNFGGALVENTIRTIRPTAPIRMVTASRGKAQRAEPISSLYELGMAKHVGVFPDLEDQFCAFSAAGYQGARSPDRADACIWALTELTGGAGAKQLQFG